MVLLLLCLIIYHAQEVKDENGKCKRKKIDASEGELKGRDLSNNHRTFDVTGF